jgi:hypothetical protein
VENAHAIGGTCLDVNFVRVLAEAPEHNLLRALSHVATQRV